MTQRSLAAVPQATGRPHAPVPDVSIVIVSRNGRDLLRDCLRSVQDQTLRPHEIIVIDNASRDGSAEMVRAEFPGVGLIANDGDRGFAAAKNQGLEVAAGRYVLLLGADTLILDGAIDTMLWWLAQHPDVGCAGCQVLDAGAAVKRTCFRDPGPSALLLSGIGLHRFPAARFFGRPHYAGWDRSDQRDVDVVSGMFMLVPRRVVDEVGPLDEDFCPDSEEADWCRRIRDAGYRCTFAPFAHIRHLEGGGDRTAQPSAGLQAQLQRCRLTYVRKHYGPLGRTAGRAALLASNVLRAVATTATQLDTSAGRDAA